ncbi:bestrophin [Roseiconus nitratireducens]|uniref:Bestrophin n=1 Tax=Roseiconus nitratireducens TaxID=2605748 RepID=A0A5M6CSG5_9BACT|nr:bestrophin family ion channel [Roseiconus nitratireducens]KAA5537943.1 bestrophin [Roseiconus nitratireducens]
MTRISFSEFVRTTHALRAASIGAVIVGVYSLIPIWKESSAFHQIADHSSGVYASLELLLGLLLVLRSNAAYGRWWEGRTLWGKLVNVSRNLVLKANSLVDVSREDRVALESLVHQFAADLRDQLRTHADGSSPAEEPHRPSDRVLQIYRLLNDWRQRGLVSDDLLRVLDSELREFLEVCGGCERIQKTPLSPSYRIFIWQGIFLVFATLPWSLASEMGIWSVPTVMIHAYFFIGVQVLAHSAEDPFGTDSDDLNLDAIVATIGRARVTA